MRNYFLEIYGTRGEEWRDGAKAAIDAFAWHKDGTRWIGSPEITIKEAYEMIDVLEEKD